MDYLVTNVESLPAEVTLRALGGAEVLALGPLLAQEYQQAYATSWHCGSAEATQAARDARDIVLGDLEGLGAFSVEAAGSHVGWVLADFSPSDASRTAFLHFIWISPEYRGFGYATAAVRALEAEAVAAGLTQMRLHVFSASKDAMRLYERCGYATAGVNLRRSLGT